MSIQKPQHLAEYRNLYNADCNAFFYGYCAQSHWYRPAEQRRTAQDIHDMVDVLADNGVDTLLVNSNAQLVFYFS